MATIRAVTDLEIAIENALRVFVRAVLHDTGPTTWAKISKKEAKYLADKNQGIASLPYWTDADRNLFIGWKPETPQH